MDVMPALSRQSTAEPSAPFRPTMLTARYDPLFWISLHARSEEHTSELQSPCNLACRLLLEINKIRTPSVNNAGPATLHKYSLPIIRITSTSLTIRRPVQDALCNWSAADCHFQSRENPTSAV